MSAGGPTSTAASVRVRHQRQEPRTVLVIGVHREELAFGEIVAARLDRNRVDVLAIPEGVSGRRPRPDQRFQYAQLHRALYMQLLPHVVGHYDLLIDLHTGLDQSGPCADLICAEPEKLAGLFDEAAWRQEGSIRAGEVRVVPLNRGGAAADAGLPFAETVIPDEIWRNPRFQYVGVEVFLPEPGIGTSEQQDFARNLICRLTELV